MTPQDPTALGAPMPTMPDAPPDPFGGMIQAIAAGFAAGFGGKTVADQIAQQRQNSWEAWQRKQDATLRREELDRADRRFAASLDMQRTQLQYEQGRDERAATERAAAATEEKSRFDMTFNAAKEERDAKTKQDTMKQAGLADFAVREGILPEGTLLADPAVVEVAQRSRSEARADERFNVDRIDRNNLEARRVKSEEDKMAFDIWRTLRSEDADVRNLDSQFRAKSLELAREDVAAGRSNSFEGSIEAYLKLFGRAETQARGGSGEVRAALDAIKGGDFSRLDELRAIPAPTSRPTETAATPVRDTVKPPTSPRAAADLARAQESQRKNTVVQAAQTQALKEAFTALATDKTLSQRFEWAQSGGKPSDKIEAAFRRDRGLSAKDPISDADFYQWLRSEIRLESDDSLTVDDLRERIAKLQFKQKPKK